MGRRFYIVWFGQLLSGTGSDLAGFGAVFWVFFETDSTTWLTVMLGAAVLPRLLGAPLAGLADRFNRRLVMIAADSGAFLATGVLIAIWRFSDLEPWHMVIATIVGGLFASLQKAAYSAAIPTLVNPQDLDRANGLIQLGPAIGAIVAPGLAGALIAWLGIGGIFVLDLASFVIGIATVTAVRFGDIPERDPEESLGLMIAVRWLRSNGRPLVALTLVLAAANVVLSGVGVAIVDRGRELGGDIAVGLGPTAGGVGMVLVSVAVGSLGIPKQRIPAAGMAIVCLGALLALSVATASLPIFVVSIGLALSTMPFLTTVIRTTFQQWVPAKYLGRVGMPPVFGAR